MRNGTGSHVRLRHSEQRQARGWTSSGRGQLERRSRVPQRGQPATQTAVAARAGRLNAMRRDPKGTGAGP